METGNLPKSLHTVRILTAVARDIMRRERGAPFPVLRAAAILGYPNATTADPLIQKACDQIASGKVLP